MTIFTTRNSLTFVNTTVIASGKKPAGASKFWCMICSRVRKRQRVTSTVFSRVIRFFAKTGFCPRLGTQPLQTITQPHCCRLLKPTPWLLCWLGEFEGPFQTPGTGLAKNRKTRENTVGQSPVKYLGVHDLRRPYNPPFQR